MRHVRVFVNKNKVVMCPAFARGECDKGESCGLHHLVFGEDDQGERGHYDKRKELKLERERRERVLERETRKENDSNMSSLNAEIQQENRRKREHQDRKLREERIDQLIAESQKKGAAEIRAKAEERRQTAARETDTKRQEVLDGTAKGLADAKSKIDKEEEEQLMVKTLKVTKPRFENLQRTIHNLQQLLVAMTVLCG